MLWILRDVCGSITPFSFVCEDDASIKICILRHYHIISKVITMHPVGNMNAVTKSNGISSNRWKNKGSPKSVWFILWGPWMSLQSFVSIRPVVVNIFYWISEKIDLLVVLDKKNKKTLNSFGTSSRNYEYLADQFLCQAINYPLRYFTG